MENRSGQGIKGYQLHERIGTGGFGAVYRAHQTTVNREVAIKIILPHFSNHPDFIRSFENEARLISRLEHLHIVPLYDYWRDPDGAYLVMRWLRSGSLRDILQKGPLTPKLAAVVIDQITSALSVAHRTSIIHRDLKPGNILLDEDGNAYLADFGIAKDISLKAGAAEPDTVVGSPDYLAPEQARGELVTPATDIYSLGVVLYEMLTSQHPFPDLSPDERLFKHLNDPLPLILNLPDDIAASVNAIIQKATAKNPAERYSDVLEMADAFRKATHTVVQDNPVEVLTLREQEILRLIVEGKSNKQIAEGLFITVSTVKWYATQIYHKLGVRTRVQAMVRARELNLITPNLAISPDLKTGIPTSEFQPANPYKGLYPFQTADNRDFFGREKLVEKLLKRMAEVDPLRSITQQSSEGEMGRFLAVVGPSGSGKSSLVKAGLIPALWRGDLSGSKKWFIVEMLPGSHPIDELEVALTRIAADQSANLHEQLLRDERGLVRTAQLLLPNDDSELILIIDQFEEVFTLVEDEQDRVRFLKLIQAAVIDTRSRIRIVITLRADFYDRPLHYTGIGELFRSRVETILPLTVDGLERAITQPAEQVGVRFEPGLVTQIISEVNYQPGALPLLQYALTELFELRKGHVLTLEAYQSIGGTIGALAKRVDELYLSMTPAGKEAARQMFLRLVTLGEGVEDTRRRVARSELMALTTDTDTMDEVIDTYVEYRLLSLDNDPNTRTPTVEVAHEAILRQWERLREWLNESREDIKQQRQVALAAQEWKASGRESSFLLHGSRLDTLAQWAATATLALTENERTFLVNSSAEQKRQQTVEETRRARERGLERRALRTLRGLVAVLLLATIGALVLSGAALNERQTAQNNAATAVRSAVESNSLVQSIAAREYLTLSQPDQALALALYANEIDRPVEQSHQVLVDAAASSWMEKRFTLAESSVLDIHYSPDGKTIAMSTNGSFRLIDPATGAVIRVYETGEERVDSLAFTPDGSEILTGSDKNTLELWNTSTGKIVTTFGGHTAPVLAVAMSPDGKTALSASEDKSVILWDMTTGKPIRTLTGHTAEVTTVAFVPHSDLALSGSNDTTVIVWNLKTGEIVRTFTAHKALVTALAVSPDGKLALSGTFYPEANPIIWNIATGESLKVLQGHNAFVLKATFSPDGQQAVTASGDDRLLTWDVTTGHYIRKLTGHNAGVASVAYSPDGRHIVSGGTDASVIIWDASADEVVHRYVHADSVNSVVVSHDGKLSLTGTSDGHIRLYDLSTNALLRDIKVADATVLGVAISPDNHLAIVATDPIPDVTIWNLTTGEKVHTLLGHTKWVNSVAFSPDGQTALSGSGDTLMIQWDVKSGQQIRQFVGNTETVRSVRFSPDGQTVLTASWSGNLMLWDVSTGKPIRTYIGHSAPVLAADFSPDGTKLLSASLDSTLIMWDTKTGQIIHRFRGHNEPVLAETFSPNGKTILSGSGDGSLILWDANTGQMLRRFYGHEGVSTVKTLAYLPDSIHALSGSDDTLMIQWKLEPYHGDLIHWIQMNRYISDISCDLRGLYNITPACDANSIFPTRTPFAP